MADSAIRIFRSDFIVLARMLTRFAIYGAALLLAATVIGQLRANRFPSYYDLVLAPLIAPAACTVLAVIFYAAVVAFPVKVFANGIRGYDAIGRYRMVEWTDISAVGFMNMYGLRYILVHAPALNQPITIPTFLEDMPEFIHIVESQAGNNHMLVHALHEAT
jgi:hypothetical protein